MANGTGKENDLTRPDTLAGSDTVRVVKSGSSRQITFSNFLAALNTLGGVSAGSVITTATNYNAAITSTYILCDTALSAITVTLPVASTATGFTITVKNIDGANNVTVQGQGASTIDGSATDTLAGLSSSSYLSDGTNWFIINA